MRKLIEQLVAFWASLQSRLVTIEDNLEVKRYGAPARRVERLRAITAWRDNALAVLVNWVDQELPKLKVEAQRQVSAALLNLTAGLPPGEKRRAAWSIPTELNVDAFLASERLAVNLVVEVGSRIDGLTTQMILSNAISLTQMQTTETLQARVSAYLEDARQGAEFSYRAWSIDRQILYQILQARASNGDARAHFVLEDFVQVERVLLARGLPAIEDSSVNLEDLKAAIERSIRGEGDGAQENLGPAEQLFGMLERALARTARAQEQETANLKFPAPRLEFDANHVVPYVKPEDRLAPGVARAHGIDQ